MKVQATKRYGLAGTDRPLHVKEGSGAPLAGGGVEALLADGDQVVAVNRLHVHRHLLHPLLQRKPAPGAARTQHTDVRQLRSNLRSQEDKAVLYQQGVQLLKEQHLLKATRSSAHIMVKTACSCRGVVLAITVSPP